MSLYQPATPVIVGCREWWSLFALKMFTSLSTNPENGFGPDEY